MKVAKDELIVAQALKILKQKKEIREFRRARKNIHGLLYSIGAPLNDNRDGYTNQQLVTFGLIGREIGM